MTQQMTTRRAGACATLLLVMGLITACGSIPGVPNVAVDGDGGSVTIQGDDGDSVTIDAGNDREIPAWLPAEMPLPSEYTVIGVVETQGGEGAFRSVTLTTELAFDDLVALIDDGLAAAGISPEGREVTNLNVTHTALFSFFLEDELWMVNMSDSGDGEEASLAYMTRGDE